MRAGLLVMLGASFAFADAPRPAPKQPPKPPALTTPDPVPPVKGPVTKLAVKASAMIGGVKVTFAYNSHKHMVAGSGPAPGMWGFEFVRGGQKQDLELRHTEPAFEAEVEAKGTLLVFRHVDYSNFEIVFVAARAPKPLDDDACDALIEKAAAKRKLPVDESSSTTEDNGIVHKLTPTWSGYCGTLTKRVWFRPPRSRH